MELCTIDGVVGCDMEIVNVCRDLKTLWNIVVHCLCRGCDGIGIAQTFRLFESLLCPDSCLEISSLVFKEVHRYIKESKAGATTEEYNLVSVRNIEELFPE